MDSIEKRKIFRELHLAEGVILRGKYCLGRVPSRVQEQNGELCFWDEEKGSLVPFSSVKHAKQVKPVKA